jgi:hypothetical protein
MSARIFGGCKDGDAYQVTLIREVQIQVRVRIDEEGTRIVNTEIGGIHLSLRDLEPHERNLCKRAAHDLKDGEK